MTLFSGILVYTVIWWLVLFTVLGLAALDENADPAYDRACAQRLANVGAWVGAMTPGELAGFVAERVGR